MKETSCTRSTRPSCLGTSIVFKRRYNSTRPNAGRYVVVLRIPYRIDSFTPKILHRSRRRLVAHAKLCYPGRMSACTARTPAAGMATFRSTYGRLATIFVSHCHNNHSWVQITPFTYNIGVDAKSGCVFCSECDDFIYDPSLTELYTSVVVSSEERYTTFQGTDC